MRFLHIIVLTLFVLRLVAQDKYDNNWVFGYPGVTGLGNGTLLDFSVDTVEVIPFDTNTWITASACISSTSGNFLFYTNGCKVVNKEHNTMPNGDGINQGQGGTGDFYCPQGIGYLSTGNLILPKPNSSNLYYYFHTWLDGPYFSKKMLYTTIDMSLDGGLGDVIEKNTLVLEDSIMDYFTATRHANGRDWWILVGEHESNRYHTLLVTPYGIEGPFTQAVGPVWDLWVNGQAVFSPDGTQYAIASPNDGLKIFDFDRCTGQLSFKTKIPYLCDPEVVVGVAFSPNSRYLYATAYLYAWQFDTYAADIEASRILVAEYDGFQSPFDTRFWWSMLAPNGKIYFSTTNSNDILHVIHKPDEAGLACDVEQHGQKLAALHAFLPPNMPHYRLYDIEGSPCDSLSINGVSTTETTEVGGRERLRVYPNPTSSSLSVHLPAGQGGTIRVFDATGVLYKKQDFVGEISQFFVSEWPIGLYFFEVRALDGRVWVEKVEVFR